MKRYIAVDIVTMREAGLTFEEWALLDNIYFLSHNEKNACYASKESLRKHLGVSNGQIYKMIKRLIDDGFLIKTEEGGLRVTKKWLSLISTPNENEKISPKSGDGTLQKMEKISPKNGDKERYIRESKKSTKKESLPRTKPKDYEYPKEFEELWDEYRVGDKWTGYRAWRKRVKEGYSIEQLERVVEVELDKKSDKKYCKHLSTLLNGDIEEYLKEWDERFGEADDDIWLSDLKMTFKEAKERGLL